MSDTGRSPTGGKPEGEPTEHLNIKVTDNNNEVFFKIKRTTQLKKLMDAFCERQGKSIQSVRFLFDGSRVQPTDSPDTVSNLDHLRSLLLSVFNLQSLTNL
jgi:Ubiquitin-2 like Rad60 SUMO-like